MEAFLYQEMAEVEVHHWWFAARRRIVDALLQQYVPGWTTQRMHVCELGCGTGGNLAMLAQRHDVIGIECSPDALRFAREKWGDRVQPGRLPDEIDLPDGRFDVVLLTDVLEHIAEDAASAKTALRILRPGGFALATVPAYQWLYSPRDAHHHHFRRYGKRQFAQTWATPQSELLFLSHYNSLLFPAAALVRLTSKVIRPRYPAGDLRCPPRPLNRLLGRVMGSEAAWLQRRRLPFGLSLVCVVRKLDRARRNVLPPCAA